MVCVLVIIVRLSVLMVIDTPRIKRVTCRSRDGGGTIGWGGLAVSPFADGFVARYGQREVDIAGYRLHPCRSTSPNLV